MIHRHHLHYLLILDDDLDILQQVQKVLQPLQNIVNNYIDFNNFFLSKKKKLKTLFKNGCVNNSSAVGLSR